jgi:hypothetical protein
MQVNRRTLTAALAPLAAAAALIPATAAHAAPGDPAAVQASGQASAGPQTVGSVFLTNINTLIKADAAGNIDPTSTISLVRNIVGNNGNVQQVPLTVNPTCLSVKGNTAFATGISGNAPVGFRFVDRTNQPPGTAGENADQLQLSFAVDGNSLSRCTAADLAAAFNTNTPNATPLFSITQGFLVVHEAEPMSSPTQNTAPATQVIEPTARRARTVCRFKRVRRHGHVRRVKVCRRVR